MSIEQTVYYKKVGRKYVPIKYHDQGMCDAYPAGTHMVVVGHNCTSYRYNVDPAVAPMLAASMYAEDKMSAAIVNASVARPRNTPVTLAQAKAWKTFAKAMGEEMLYVQYPSASDIAQVGTKALREETEKMLKNDTVRKAYEQFLLLWKLTKEAEPK